MCRFIAYLGKPILLDDILFKPRNSLIKQSVKAREMPDPTNGDGFGMGWYAHELDEIPATYVSTQPAWNDINLVSMAPKIRSSCLFAHIRAASCGGITVYNCHPFRYKQYLMMHNGFIEHFDTIKRAMRRQLDDDIYNWIKGQTDSEHFGAHFLQNLYQLPEPRTVHDIALQLKKSLHEFEELKREFNAEPLSLINYAITDGHNLVVSRYSSLPEQRSNTLYYAKGAELNYDEGIDRMISVRGSDETQAVLVASERLTSYDTEWLEVPVNHILVINQALQVELIAI